MILISTAPKIRATAAAIIIIIIIIIITVIIIYGDSNKALAYTNLHPSIY
jgi:hypothetical protein